MKYDLIIVGSGIVGATLALALAQKTSLSIALLESRPEKETWKKDRISKRVSAVTPVSQRIFKALSVWEPMQNKRISPFSRIEVWDEAKTKIYFDSNEISQRVLGHIVENNVIQDALDEKIKAYPQITSISPIKIISFSANDNEAVVVSDDERVFSAKLLIGADGANSFVREHAQIKVNRVDYNERAIVATVTTYLPHQGVARQKFAKKGILAFLPLHFEKVNSIVWSLPNDEAKRLISLTDEEFKTELHHNFEPLGEILEVDERMLFPLYKQETRHYIQSRLALIGDAAHTVHPLAGQGVNMGLLDAASLCDVIEDALKVRADIGSRMYLRRYERWRKADHFALMQGLDIIKNLYMSEKKSANFLKRGGLYLTQHSKWLKNLFIQHAIGERRNLPRLASVI